jgi:hypothetical protein
VGASIDDVRALRSSVLNGRVPPRSRNLLLQLARDEVTIGEAADLVDRSTIMRIRAVAKDRALAALAES